jgi:hypothetical protein
MLSVRMPYLWVFFSRVRFTGVLYQWAHYQKPALPHGAMVKMSGTPRSKEPGEPGHLGVEAAVVLFTPNARRQAQEGARMRWP